jgi:hypothetical protein
MKKNDSDKPPSKNKNRKSNSLIKKAGIIYSEVKREYFPTEEQYITEKDAFDEAMIIAKYLKKVHIKPLLYPVIPYWSKD